jgi:hypothetical protein
MIDLEYILKYLKLLKEFYNMPMDTDLRFCLHSDGSASVRTDKKSIASFDTIQDLERTLNNIFT